MILGLRLPLSLVILSSTFPRFEHFGAKVHEAGSLEALEKVEGIEGGVIVTEDER